MTTPTQPAEVERFAAKLAASDGLDWNEACAYEGDDAPDNAECNSGTCVAAHYEDHDPEAARGNYLKWARIALDEARLASTNDICCEITRVRNTLYQAGKDASPKSPAVENMAKVLELAFKVADPDATYKFDWSDFGPYNPTDKGAAVVAALSALRSSDGAGEPVACEASQDDLRALVRDRAEEYRGKGKRSGITTWALAHGISKSRISDFMAGKRDANPAILSALGARRAVVMEQQPKAIPGDGGYTPPAAQSAGGAQVDKLRDALKALDEDETFDASFTTHKVVEAARSLVSTLSASGADTEGQA